MDREPVVRLRKAGDSVRIYPLVCMHLGAKQSAIPFIKEHIQRIADDPDGYAVYMGDAGECNLKNSKGDVYSQTLSPEEQLDAAVELMAPIKDKLLFGISGNHGRRILKATGLDWDGVLCYKLGIPYLGLAGWLRITMVGPKGFMDVLEAKQRSISYDCYFHHGSASAITTGGKVNAAKKFDSQVDADAIFTAHTHVCMALPPETIAGLATRRDVVIWKEKYPYICGCGYDSRVPGYALEKGYPPILPAYLSVEFFNNYDKGKVPSTKRQSCTIYRMKV